MANPQEGTAPLAANGIERDGPSGGPSPSRPLPPGMGEGFGGGAGIRSPNRGPVLTAPPGFNIRSPTLGRIEEGGRRNPPPSRPEDRSPLQGGGQRGEWSPRPDERRPGSPLSYEGAQGRNLGSRTYVPGATATIRVERNPRPVEAFEDAQAQDMGEIEGWDSLDVPRNLEQILAERTRPPVIESWARLSIIRRPVLPTREPPFGLQGLRGERPGDFDHPRSNDQRTERLNEERRSNQDVWTAYLSNSTRRTRKSCHP
jgi:hypothetical protein